MFSGLALTLTTQHHNGIAGIVYCITTGLIKHRSHDSGILILFQLVLDQCLQLPAMIIGRNHILFSVRCICFQRRNAIGKQINSCHEKHGNCFCNPMISVHTYGISFETMISGMVPIKLHHIRKQRFNQWESISIQTNSFQLTFAAYVYDFPVVDLISGIDSHLMNL